MDDLTTDDVRGAYTRMKEAIVRATSLRECERDALDLVELETDWAGIRDGLMLDGVHAAGAELDGRMLLRVRDDVRRAKDAVSLISDGRYRLLRDEHAAMRADGTDIPSGTQGM